MLFFNLSLHTLSPGVLVFGGTLAEHLQICPVNLIKAFQEAEFYICTKNVFTEKITKFYFTKKPMCLGIYGTMLNTSLCTPGFPHSTPLYSHPHFHLPDIAHTETRPQHSAAKEKMKNRKKNITNAHTAFIFWSLNQTDILE